MTGVSLPPILPPMRARSVLPLFALLVAPHIAAAGEPTASDILERARRTGALGLVGARAEVKLVLEDGKGGRRERTLTAMALDHEGVTRRLVRFHSPADVRGVGFLVVEKEGKSPERLLYLPAQKRIRRVSARQGGQSFLETDFAYADLDLAGGSDDAHERLKDEAVEGNACHVVATRPADKTYGRIVTYVHKDTGVPLLITFHDQQGELVKRLKATRVKQQEGRWYAVESVMETPGKGTKTTLTITKLDTKATLSPQDFTEQALEAP